MNLFVNREANRRWSMALSSMGHSQASAQSLQSISGPEIGIHETPTDISTIYQYTTDIDITQNIINVVRIVFHCYFIYVVDRRTCIAQCYSQSYHLGLEKHCDDTDTHNQLLNSTTYLLLHWQHIRNYY